MKPACEYGVVTAEPEKAQQTLRQYLYRDNAKRIGEYTIAPLAYYAQDKAGLLLGGAYAFVKLGWLEIEMLWVQEEVRRQGIATKLLAYIEKTGREKGAHWACLTTASFQDGLPLYQKNGYQPYAELPFLDTKGEKHLRYYLQKTLIEV